MLVLTLVAVSAISSVTSSVRPRFTVDGSPCFDNIQVRICSCVCLLQLDHVLDKNVLNTFSKSPRDETASKKSNMEASTHVAELQALLELGQIALLLGEVDSATGVFERRLRYVRSGVDARTVELPTLLSDSQNVKTLITVLQKCITRAKHFCVEPFVEVDPLSPVNI